MNTDKRTTVSDFFALRIMDPSGKKSAIETIRKVSELKDKLAREAKVVKWPVVFDEIVGKIDDILDLDMGDLITTAWNKYRVLHEYADKEKYAPTETFLVPLAEHTIKSVHRPSIEILVNENPIGKIAFEINLSLTLKGCTVKIQDGKMKEIKTGACQGKGTIKCEDLLILEKETESFQLPGLMNLGEGVPITIP